MVTKCETYMGCALGKWVKLPRGIRNNNPLNIRVGDKWAGLVPCMIIRNTEDIDHLVTQVYDKSFCQFESMAYGFRAAAKLLQNYQDRYNLKTIRDIVRRWAPPTENNTEGYIKLVSSYSFLEDSFEINTHNTLHICNLVWAMCVVECGNAYDPMLNDFMQDEWIKAVAMLKKEGRL